MNLLIRRLAVTLLTPLVLLVAGRYVSLPGVDANEIERLGGDRSAAGVFALGVMPFLSGYMIVEVVAFLVPRWSRLRHRNPEGRAKLERASLVLAMLLAAVQGWTSAIYLQALGTQADTFEISVPVVAVTLVGGACIQLAAARFISRHGLLNGFVALVGASSIVSLVSSVEGVLGWRAAGGYGGPTPSALASGVRLLAIVVAAVASWVILRGADRAPVEEDKAPSPRIPLLSSSLQPYGVGAALLVIPSTLLGDGAGDRSQLFARGPYIALQLVIVAVTMVVFARVMHRPRELADLAQRIGSASIDELRAHTRTSLRRTFVPSLLFFAVLIVAASISMGEGISLVPLVVAATLDLVAAIGAESAQSDWVPVWEERRPSAVPVICAALAADGITVSTRGDAILALLQVFAPYAPVTFHVPPADVERAVRTLRQSFVESEVVASSSIPVAPPREAAYLSRALVMPILGVCLAIAGIAFGVTHLPSKSAARMEDGPRAKLEVVRVDDASDPFGAANDVPNEEGIAIAPEWISMGTTHAQTHFARTALRAGESKASALARMRAWLAKIEVPAGSRFALGDVFEEDGGGRAPALVGVRTYLLAGEAVLGTDDVLDAKVAFDPPQTGGTHVAITLSEGGGQRFEDVTRTWTRRRLAILLDDEVKTAPVIQTPITGRRLIITVGQSAPETQAAEAQRVAHALGGSD